MLASLMRQLGWPDGLPTEVDDVLDRLRKITVRFRSE